MRSDSRLNRAAVAALLAWSLVPASASAEITDVRSQTVGAITLRSGDTGSIVIGPIVDGPASNYRNDGSGFGAGYGALAEISDTSIAFQSSSMAANERNRSTSLTEVSIDFVGDTPGGEVDRLVSTIFGSSFGFYVGSFGIGGCAGDRLPNCEVASGGQGFSSAVLGAEPVGDALAGIEIGFDVLVDGVHARTIEGSITMVRDLDGNIAFVENFGSGDDALGAVLLGFSLTENSDYAYFYSWEQTDVTTFFDDAIGFGEAATVSFTVRADSWVQTRNLGNNAVIAFGCIKDPLGRGGRSEPVGAQLGAPLVESFQSLPVFTDSICDDYVDPDGNPESRYQVGLPRVVDGAIVFGGAVPEPATWAMLIAGFGLVGAAVRRRQALA
jgi:hypothetical protein